MVLYASLHKCALKFWLQIRLLFEQWPSNSPATVFTSQQNCKCCLPWTGGHSPKWDQQLLWLKILWPDSRWEMQLKFVPNFKPWISFLLSQGVQNKNINSHVFSQGKRALDHSVITPLTFVWVLNLTRQPFWKHYMNFQGSCISHQSAKLSFHIVPQAAHLFRSREPQRYASEYCKPSVTTDIHSFSIGL